ncbi:MAG: PorT family protein [Dysgonamonadaceae bacterium]|jgi:hypothetical protein|nr:PorT family protein [Dysgonamonadaceae bacterium]
MKNINNIQNDRFDEIIRNKLADYSLPIQEDSWGELESRLAAEEHRKNFVFWPWISGISIAASIALVWFLYPLIKNVIRNEDNTQLSCYEERISTSAFPEASDQFSCHPSRRNLSPVQQSSCAENDARASTAPRYDVIPSSLELLVIEPVKIFNPLKRKLRIEKTLDLPLLCVQANRVPKRHSSLGLHFGSGGVLLAQNTNITQTSHLRVSKISQNPPSFLKKEMLTPADFNRMVHRPPVSFGLSVRKELTRFLSIESGLSYTFLSSHFENTLPLQEANLDLHYVGVPLNLIANIYGNRYTRWNFYFSVGGMIEKGLFSHYVQTVYEDPSVAIISKSDEKIKGFQYSLQSALGIDFKITKDYSLYLEPQIIYYLSNNQPFNIRTEHPLVFGMNVGVRYNW